MAGPRPFKPRGIISRPMSAIFRFRKAVVCCIPDSLPAAALRQDEAIEPVNLEVARKQHNKYIDTLRKVVGLEVIEMEADELCPDCVFVEDPVVVCNNTALMTIPGHESRRREVVKLRNEMIKVGLHVKDMVDPGRMDGGDVLFTGREFFVGISTRTNQDGIDQLAATFKYPVTAIPVEAGLHLKSFCSMAGPNLIAIGNSTAAIKAKEIMSCGNFKYQFLSVPDDNAANCVYANDVLIHTSKDFCSNTFDKVDCKTKVALSASELNKVDGCFTCCSVLIP